jgi:ectoine hydroxylase-related dioxygenase (phytanoyl-CoA dioxygenase family)
VKLSADQIAQYDRDGFLYYGELLSKDEVTNLRLRFDDLFESTEFKGPRKAGVELRADASGGAKDSVQQIIDVYKRDPAFEALIHDERILDVTESLIGPNIKLLADQALLKPAYHGGELPWHQDNSYFLLDPPDSVTCWIALTDVTEENSPLRLIPGSHKAGLIEHDEGFEGTIMKYLNKSLADDAKAVTVTVPQGHASWHHCQTLHNTRPNRSPHPRPVFAIQYISSDCRSVSGNEERNRRLESLMVVRGRG